MKRSFNYSWQQYVGWLFTICLVIGFVLPAGADVNDNQMYYTVSMTSPPPDLKYGIPVGASQVTADPMPMVIVVENRGDAFYISKGFAEKAFHTNLVLKDERNKRYELQPDSIALDPEPQLSLGSREVSPVEQMTGTWTKVIEVDDLMDLFPILKTRIGWYTLTAELAYRRYQNKVTVGSKDYGFDDTAVKFPLKTNIIQFEIVPKVEGENNKGGEIGVLVYGESVDEPITNAAIRLYETANMAGLDPDMVWADSTIPYVFGGFDYATNMWLSGCLAQEAYTIIVSHNGYKAQNISADDQRWAAWDGSTCIRLEETVFMGDFSGVNQFAVLALNSIWMRSKSKVLFGDVGVLDASQGPWLRHDAELSMDPKAQVKPIVNLFADSLWLGPKTVVYDIHYNELFEQNARIKGEQFTPMALPLDADVPLTPDVIPGDQDIVVRADKTVELAEGQYGNVTVMPRGTLILEEGGGFYDFENLKMFTKAALVYRGSTEVLISKRLYTGIQASIVPADGATPNDLFIYVDGQNGKKGGLKAHPKAAMLGVKNTVKANLYIPNGTLWLMEGAYLTGSIIARDVILGVKSKVKLHIDE